MADTGGLDSTDPPGSPTLAEALAVVFDFGEFKGRTLAYLAAVEPDYLEWALQTIHDRPDLTRSIRVVMDDYYRIRPDARARADAASTQAAKATIAEDSSPGTGRPVDPTADDPTPPDPVTPDPAPPDPVSWVEAGAVGDPPARTSRRSPLEIAFIAAAVLGAAAVGAFLVAILWPKGGGPEVGVTPSAGSVVASTNPTQSGATPTRSPASRPSFEEDFVPLSSYSISLEGDLTLDIDDAAIDPATDFCAISTDPDDSTPVTSILGVSTVGSDRFRFFFDTRSESGAEQMTLFLSVYTEDGLDEYLWVEGDAIPGAGATWRDERTLALDVTATLETPGAVRVIATFTCGESAES